MFKTAFSCIKTTCVVSVFCKGLGVTVHVRNVLFKIGNVSLHKKKFGEIQLDIILH